MSEFISKMYNIEVGDLLRSVNFEAYERPEGVIWPSEATADLGIVTVGSCRRSLYYRFTGVKPTNPLSLRVKYVCDSGKMYEQMFVDKYRKSGMLLETQCKIEFSPPSYPNIKISGKMDILIQDNGVKTGIEVKSISGFKADEIFGSNKSIPLPTPNNLMQAMMYKHQCMVKGNGIKDIYLLYINRNNGYFCYFKIDIDPEGYPIISVIGPEGELLQVIETAKYPTLRELSLTSEEKDPNSARISSLRINIDSIYQKFDEIFQARKAKTLPPKDYKLLYTIEDAKTLYHCGLMTARKFKMIQKGTKTDGDDACSMCQYQKKCLEDTGINLK